MGVKTHTIKDKIQNTKDKPNTVFFKRKGKSTDEEGVKKIEAAAVLLYKSPHLH
jgi:hypothetical protein